jgi:hypothetical protein
MSKLYEITVTPTVTAGAYSAKDVVGGLLTFANAASVYRGSGILRKITITNDAFVANLLNLSLFNAAPAVIADNAPFDPSDAEMKTCIGVIPIVAADYLIGTDNAIATKLVEFPYVLAAGGTSLFGYLWCVATPTFVATTDTTVKLTIER